MIDLLHTVRRLSDESAKTEDSVDSGHKISEDLRNGLQIDSKSGLQNAIEWFEDYLAWTTIRTFTRAENVLVEKGVRRIFLFAENGNCTERIHHVHVE